MITDRIKNHIENVQGKSHEARKQYLWMYLIILMIIVAGIWAFSLHVRYGIKKVSTRTQEEIKPFQIFGNAIKSLTASVGNVGASAGQSKPKSNEKMIPLTVVDN